MRSAETHSQAIEEKIVDFDTALEVVLEQAGALHGAGEETVALTSARTRVLARPVASDRDQPPFDRSTRDGYAVRASELMRDGWLRVVGSIRAGQRWEQSMDEAAAIGIMTGAPVPPEADAVVMLEHVERRNDAIQLTVGRRLAAGENIVPTGSEARRGDVVLPEGTVMGAAAVALAASCGASSLTVFRRPVVAVVATGDELVEIDQTPGPAEIRNSNSYGLAALVEEAGATPLRLPAAKDTRASLEAAIRQAREADLLLLSGGVSMGEYDLVEEVLRAMGAEFHFTGVRMQPGKPVVFGRLPEREGMKAIPFFGLPGNPVSTQVTFACFVEPLLRAMRGAEAAPPPFTEARMAHDVDGRPGLTRLLPARIRSSREGATVELVAWQGSGDMAANARANGYAVFPQGVERFRQGASISVLLQ